MSYSKNASDVGGNLIKTWYEPPTSAVIGYILEPWVLGENRSDIVPGLYELSTITRED